jgi:hypothetical protein
MNRILVIVVSLAGWFVLGNDQSVIASDVKSSGAPSTGSNPNRKKIDEAFQKAECARKQKAAVCKDAKSMIELRDLGCGSLLKEGLSLVARYKEITGSLPPKISCPDVPKSEAPKGGSDI